PGAVVLPSGVARFRARELRNGHAYAYLLGRYLGDGCLALGPRAVYSLRIRRDDSDRPGDRRGAARGFLADCSTPTGAGPRAGAPGVDPMARSGATRSRTTAVSDESRD